jgi:Lon protease-like protein
MTIAGRPDEIPDSVPVFPLPDVVLFPRTVLPLHIFEPRYREMVAAALEGDGCIAMALLRPGWEADYQGSPAYHDVGCVGRITEAARTEDGRYYLKLVGHRKVVFGELVGDGPYRTARLRAVEEAVPDDQDPESREELVRLLGVCAVLAQELSEKSFPLVTVDQGLPYEPVVNSVCFHVGIPAEVKQSLLEEDDVRARCRRLTELLEAHLHKVVLARDDGSPDEEPERVN